MQFDHTFTTKDNKIPYFKNVSTFCELFALFDQPHQVFDIGIKSKKNSHALDHKWHIISALRNAYKEKLALRNTESIFFPLTVAIVNNLDHRPHTTLLYVKLVCYFVYLLHHKLLKLTRLSVFVWEFGHFILNYFKNKS